ncbi:MAG: transposase [Magnetococcales bacterium]|nr:transposase [Magnetococcales bacterium]
MAGFFREPDRRQMHLLPVDMLEWVPEDDIAHLILDVVEGMDLSRFKARYQVGGVGAPALSPGMMLAVLIYGYCHGYTSSRKLERLCVRDAGFRMIVGEHTPDHATIARFRRNHLADVQELFIEVLKLCRKAGLARLGLVALDGTKVKGNAALESNRTLTTIEDEVTALLSAAEATDVREDALHGDRRGDELPEGMRNRKDRLERLQACRVELQREQSEKAGEQDAKVAAREAEEATTGKKRRGRKPKPGNHEVAGDAKANVTDPDSRILKTRKGWVQGYNAQAVVTEDQIIVAAVVTQDRNDVEQLKPMLALAWANMALIEEDPEIGVALADAGYWSEENDQAATDDCELLIATRKDWKQRRNYSAPHPKKILDRVFRIFLKNQMQFGTPTDSALYRPSVAAVPAPEFACIPGSLALSHLRSQVALRGKISVQKSRAILLASTRSEEIPVEDQRRRNPFQH